MNECQDVVHTLDRASVNSGAKFVQLVLTSVTKHLIHNVIGQITPAPPQIGRPSHAHATFRSNASAERLRASAVQLRSVADGREL